MTSPATVSLRIPRLKQPLQLRVHDDRDRYISRRLREEGVWEPFETSLLLALLRPGHVFLDVGANLGYFSLLAASVVGDQGRVFSFEPDPANYRLLLANAALNHLDHRITAVAAALAEDNGSGHLYLSEDNLGDHQVYRGDEPRSRVPITLYRGSEYLAGKLQRLDLVKVDTQGSEYQVISGLMPLLRNFKPRLMVELTPHSLRLAGNSGRALIELLATLEQPMWIIDHTTGRLAPSSAPELALWCDNWDAVPESRGFMNILVGEKA